MLRATTPPTTNHPQVSDIVFVHKNVLGRFFELYIWLNLVSHISSPGKTIWQLVLEQFDDLLVKILLLAAIISFVSIYTNMIHPVLAYTQIHVSYKHIKYKCKVVKMMIIRLLNTISLF